MTMTTAIKNIKEACADYVEHMKEKGQKAATLGTIKRNLDLLIGEMGEDKEIGKILPVHVANFYKSDTVNLHNTKEGLKPRAVASALQIKRNARLALVYWHEQGWIEKVPVPADERKLVEKKAAGAEKKAKKQAKKWVAEPDAPKEAPGDTDREIVLTGKGAKVEKAAEAQVEPETETQE
jgi:hypothetical protein